MNGKDSTALIRQKGLKMKKTEKKTREKKVEAGKERRSHLGELKYKGVLRGRGY